MPVAPVGEGPLDLFVDEQTVLLIGSMQRDPRKYSDTKFYAGASFDATIPTNDPHTRECRCQQRERVYALVKAEDDAWGRIDEYALDERWHVCSRLTQQRHRPVVDQVDGHGRLKDSGLDRDFAGAQLLDEVVVQSARL